MKLRQIITEDREESFWKENFSNYFSMNKTKDGWNFEPNLRAKEISISELPYKINKVENVCDLMGIDLENLNNTPNECEGLLLGWNNISSVATNHLIKTKTLNLAENPISNLQGLKVSDLEFLSLEGCQNLKTLNGLQNTKVNNLNLMNCQKFEDDLFKYRNSINTVKIDLAMAPNMPLVFLIVFGKPSIDNINDISNPVLKTIVNKYYQKGPSEVFDLIRELRDAKFIKATQVK